MVASSFSSDMPIGPMRRPLRNCCTTGSSLVSSTSRGPNMTSLLAEQHAHVVRHRAGDVDVVRHDEDGGVDLGVDVDDQLAQVGGTDRVQTRVGLVAEDDLRVEHQRAGQAGTLAHTAGDLAGELLLVTAQTDHVQLLHDDVTDLAFLLLGVLTQREGGVVVEVHRAEQRTVLEHARRTACGSRRAPWPSIR